MCTTCPIQRISENSHKAQKKEIKFANIERTYIYYFSVIWTYVENIFSIMIATIHFQFISNVGVLIISLYISKVVRCMAEHLAMLNLSIQERLGTVFMNWLLCWIYLFSWIVTNHEFNNPVSSDSSLATAGLEDDQQIYVLTKNVIFCKIWKLSPQRMKINTHKNNRIHINLMD